MLVIVLALLLLSARIPDERRDTEQEAWEALRRVPGDARAFYGALEWRWR